MSILKICPPSNIGRVVWAAPRVVAAVEFHKLACPLHEAEHAVPRAGWDVKVKITPLPETANVSLDEPGLVKRKVRPLAWRLGLDAAPCRGSSLGKE